MFCYIIGAISYFPFIAVFYQEIFFKKCLILATNSLFNADFVIVFWVGVRGYVLQFALYTYETSAVFLNSQTLHSSLTINILTIGKKMHICLLPCLALEIMVKQRRLSLPESKNLSNQSEFSY